jgi:hypothetical protein
MSAKILVRGNNIIEPHEASSLVRYMREVAEPTMRVSRHILETISWEPGWFAPSLTLTKPAEGHGSAGHAVGLHEECRGVHAGQICFVNRILRLETAERTLVWRVQRYRADDCETWELAWPD